METGTKLRGNRTRVRHVMVSKRIGEKSSDPLQITCTRRRLGRTLFSSRNGHGDENPYGGSSRRVSDGTPQRKLN